MKRLRRYSLRTLLVATTLCGLLLAGWRASVDPYRQQQAAVAMVGRRYGQIASAPQQRPAWQKWLVESALGEGAFSRVTKVDLSDAEFTQRDAELLAGLRWVEDLNLQRSAITDEGLAALGSLQSLRVLNLGRCGVTDEGLARLGSQELLADLRLTGCDISDRSVERIASWAGLRTLMVRWTRMTPAGVERLAEELPQCEVVYQPGYAGESP